MKAQNLGRLLLVALSLSVLTGCQTTNTSGESGKTSDTPKTSDTGKTSTSTSTREKTAVEKALEDAEGLTQDKLFEKAAAELGTTNKLRVLATTSRGNKPAVADLFLKKLQAYNKDITAPLNYQTTVDGQIYTKINAGIDSNNVIADCAILQDGYQLSTKGTKYLNFIPKEWKEATGVNVSRDSKPFALQYNFKTIMYNNKGLTDFKIDNVWDLTDSSMKGKIDTMDPNNENVNMDFLIQLTSDSMNAELKAAYEDTATRNSDVDLNKYSKYGEKKYSYAFIDKFLTNAIFYDDDGKAIGHLANTPGTVGWIVYSKLLKVEESEAISKKNIVVAALGATNDDKEAATSAIKGFSGFMYKHYLQVMPNCAYPYAAAAFFSLISTNADAYSVWGKDVGDYPTLPSINVDRTKNGYVDGTNTYPCLNDKSSDWWIDTAKAGVEDPAYIGANYDSVIDFIDASISAK
jgi:hypothetical protein